MATAQGLIPFAANDTSGYQIPKGLTATSTPQGGSAFTDTNGTYGQVGAMYIKGVNGYTLAPNSLPSTSFAKSDDGSGTIVATPISTTQPVQPSGTTVRTQVAPTMPSSVKIAIESAANAESNSIGSGVPTTSSGASTTPTVDYTLHQGETIDQYNARIAQEQQAGNGTSDSGTSSTSPSKGSVPNINDYIGALGAAPTAPNLNADQTAEENAVGISAIQTNVQNLTTQLQSAQAQALTDEGAEASKPGVVASVINGRIKMISAEDAVAITNLQNQIKDAQSQLTQANSVVSTYMKNDELSYSDAEKAYTDAYTKAIAQYNDSVSQQDKQQTAAKANAQLIINSYKGSTAGVDSITDYEKAQWSSLELQAGLPAGTILAAAQNAMSVDKIVSGSNGAHYLIGTDADGNPTVTQVIAGTTKAKTTTTASGTWTKDQLNEATNKMSSALQSAAGTDGMVNNDTWQQAKSDWISAGGTATTFETQFNQYKSTNQ